MHLRQGDIVLVPVPFTDLSSRKRRPLIVVSSDAYSSDGPDMVVVAMTSNTVRSPWSFEISNDQVAEGRLNRPGTVRVDKIYTLKGSPANGTSASVARRMSGS
jgi:mRNA interferase MazF